MTIEHIKKIIKEIEENFEIKFCDYREEKRGGKITFVFYTIQFKVD